MSYWLKKQLVKAEKYEFPFQCKIERFVENLLTENVETLMVYVDIKDNDNREEKIAILFNEKSPFHAPDIYFMNEKLVHPFIKNGYVMVKDWFAGETLVSLILNLYCIWQEAINSESLSETFSDSHDI